ncbi:MAG: hypothetical protein KJZ74_11065 [Gemmatimonadales bacterium]|nr:hypothetical protein [Gemmatimonadales bacterium]
MTPRTQRSLPRRAIPVAIASALLLAALAPALVSPLAAQIIRVPTESNSGPPIHLSATFGFLQTQNRFDGQSGTFWTLGEALAYRASLDIGLRAGAIGVTAGLASVPLRRSGGTAVPGSSGDIQLRQYLATFRTVEAQGFHQIVEVSMGLAQWTGYSGSDVLTAAEQEARNAFALVVGYGFGFSLGERAAITLVQDYTTLWGSAEGLPSGQSRSVRQYTTRVGLRYRLRGER